MPALVSVLIVRMRQPGKNLTFNYVKTILPDYIVEGPDVSVVYLPRSNLSAKVKAFVEFLTLTVEGIERA
jgi:DNA-binding transcriptional LysR family regulator